MGKGSNVQKAQQARERNQKKEGKSDEERRAAAAKAKADSTAFVCEKCKQAFMVNARPPVLYLHVCTKHKPEEFKECFPVALANFDPDDPNGEKAAAAAKKAEAERAAKKKAKAKAAGSGLDLLSEGLSAGKKKGKKR